LPEALGDGSAYEGRENSHGQVDEELQISHA
jgi:hypothetical protein